MSRMCVACIVAELEGRDLQRRFARVGRLGAADQRDDRVDHVERLQQAFEDVRAITRLAEPVLAAPRDDLDLMATYTSQRLHEVEQPRHTVDQREHVRGEVRLHRRVLVELVEHDLRVRVALELDDEPRVSPADSLRTSRMPSMRRSLTSSAIFVPMTSTEVWYGTSVTTMRWPPRRLRRSRRPPACESSRGPCGSTRRSRAAEDRRPVGKSGPVHELHEVFDRRVGIVDQVQRGVDDLAQVVRRDVRGHADRDAAAAVHEQVREARRQNERLSVAGRRRCRRSRRCPRRSRRAAPSRAATSRASV